MKRCDDCRYRNEPEYNKPCVVYRADCPLYEKEGDGMNREEAIEELKAIKSAYSDKNFHTARLMRSEHAALDMAIQALEQEPCGETVSLEAFKQIMWERDIAIEQLKELGYDFGQKIEPRESEEV